MASKITKKFFTMIGFLVTTWVFVPSVDSQTIARISLETTPPSKIYIDGRFVKKSPLNKFKVTPGSHVVRFENKKLGASYELNVTIEAGKHLLCTYNFESGISRCKKKSSGKVIKKGKLDAISVPPSTLYVDGKKIGKTPIKKMELTAGQHELQFRHPKYETLTQVIDVQGGVVQRVEVNFSPQSTNKGD